jgi:hypothetical protein
LARLPSAAADKRDAKRHLAARLRFFNAADAGLAYLLILYLGGVFRSIQFTGVSTLAFADVPPAQMSYANTLFSTASQLAVGWGSPSARSAFAWVKKPASG